MKSVCLFCGKFLRWAEPFDQVGIKHGVCLRCLRSNNETATMEPVPRQPEAKVWAAWQDVGGEG